MNTITLIIFRTKATFPEMQIQTENEVRYLISEHNAVLFRPRSG